MNPMRTLVKYLQARKQRREQEALFELKARYHVFRIFLENNGRALELIAAVDDHVHRGCDDDLRATVEELVNVSLELVDGVNLLAEDRHARLYRLHGRLADAIAGRLGMLTGDQELLTACLALDEPACTMPLFSGTKAATLARLRRLGLPVPNGFVCTVRACRSFLHHGELAVDLERIMREMESERIDSSTAAAAIQEMILAAPMPPELAAALADAHQHLAASEGLGNAASLAVSVRSSGVTEDGLMHSFAGQFTSVLNVCSQDALLIAVRRVIASGFSARAMAYRINAGLSPAAFDLAVLIQRMAPAEAAGVLFTVDPSKPEGGHMLISAAPGLGTTAVDGSAPVDLYRPRREVGEAHSEASDALLFKHADIARKTLREVPDDGGGLRRESIPEEEADLPLLSASTIRELALLGLTIERIEGLAQDVEWAYTAANGLAILQARPLRLGGGADSQVRVPNLAEPMFSGSCASSGKVVGKVRLVRSAEELQQLDGRFVESLLKAPSILVLPHSLVEAARLLPHCAGVIVDIGNPTDHLACIAREFGLPMITGTGAGLYGLDNDQWVIVDADKGLVLAAPESVREQSLELWNEMYAGKGSRTMEAKASSSPFLSPERRAIRDLIVPLNLTDAYGPTFSELECKTIHDLVRFTHEMAVLAMFRVGDQVMEDAGSLLRPLDIGVPFSFLVIDVGGGVRLEKQGARQPKLAIRHPLGKEDILSVPLAALCEGLTTPGLSWHSMPDPEAMADIFSKTMLDQRGPRPAGSFNYALAARDYLNLNARVEYHFAMIDAVCSRDRHANYVRFRFKGGGAGLERGHRRALFLQQVMAHHGFYTTLTGDLITASLAGADRERIRQSLVMLGRLLGFSRFLDGVMIDDEMPQQLAEAFLAGRFDARTVQSTAVEKPVADAGRTQA